MSVDRVENWRKFSEHMENYIRDRTVAKYGVKEAGGIDLMSVTEPRVCIWNILKYTLRLWNGKGKKHDMEKIAHYAELAWTLSGEEKQGEQEEHMERAVGT